MPRPSWLYRQLHNCHRIRLDSGNTSAACWQRTLEATVRRLRNEGLRRFRFEYDSTHAEIWYPKFQPRYRTRLAREIGERMGYDHQSDHSWSIDTRQTDQVRPDGSPERTDHQPNSPLPPLRPGSRAKDCQSTMRCHNAILQGSDVAGP